MSEQVMGLRGNTRQQPRHDYARWNVTKIMPYRIEPVYINVDRNAEEG